MVSSFRVRCRTMVPAGDRLRLESIIASSRAFVATTALLAIYVDPTEPAGYAVIAYAFLAGYAVLAVAIVVMVRRGGRLPDSLPLITHAVDVCVAAALTLFTDGPNSPFFIFFIYAMLVAASRWGLWATVASAGMFACLLSIEAVLIGRTSGLATGFVEGQFDLNRLIMRTTYLGIAGLLFGYFGEKEQLRQIETSVVSLINRRAQVSAGMLGMFESAVGAALQLFAARGALVVVEEPHTDRAHLWSIEPVADSEHIALSVRALDTVARAKYLSDASGCGWHIVQRRGGMDTIALDGDGLRVPVNAPVVTPEFLRHYTCDAVLSVPFHLRRKLTGRVFFLEPRVGFYREGAVRLAQRLADVIGPTAHNVYRLRRVRSRAEGQERARIARELHDGVVQALSATELRLDLIRQHIEASRPEDAAEIERIQASCRQEVRDLRLLTRSMQRVPRRSPARDDDLTAIVERFKRETGIDVRYESDHRKEGISARTRREMGRIVREGLVNIRKHSGARHVLVSESSSNGRWKVSIEDDGRGFPFAGRRSQSELDATQQGPLVIKERVRVLHGRFSVESTPGKGARLELDVPTRR
jgi:signal transduction histidine kinase